MPFRFSLPSLRCVLPLCAAGALLACSQNPPTPAPGFTPVQPSTSADNHAAVATPNARVAAELAQPPYAAAVAARFPDPAVNYRTPAFDNGRTAFTSNAELQFLLRGLARPAGPDGTWVTVMPLGSSQNGVALEALVFTRSTDPTPSAVLQSGRPTVLLIGQQHGDEPAGSEALLVLAQKLAHGKLQNLLEHINVVILPRANPDGAQAVQRATRSGVDANRDHLLLKTPEAQAQARLVREFQPLVIVDAHEYPVVGRYLEKFGAIQRYDALLQYAMTANLPPFITKASEEWFREPMLSSLAQQGLTSQWYYTTSTDPADKKISIGGVQPDTGRNVNGLTNAVSILIETRGVGLGRLHFKRRVFTHVTAI